MDLSFENLLNLVEKELTVLSAKAEGEVTKVKTKPLLCPRTSTGLPRKKNDIRLEESRLQNLNTYIPRPTLSNKTCDDRKCSVVM